MKRSNAFLAIAAALFVASVIVPQVKASPGAECKSDASCPVGKWETVPCTNPRCGGTDEWWLTCSKCKVDP